MTQQTRGPLDGVRVVEIASLPPAPFGCMILADLGAQVLPVERSGQQRGLVPPPGPIDRNKRSVAVDLKDPAGVAAVRRFVRAPRRFGRRSCRRRS